MPPLGCFTFESQNIFCPLDKKVCGPHCRFVRGVEEKVFTVVPINLLVVNTSKELTVALYLQIGI